MNPNEVFHNTAYSVQLPYIAGHYLKHIIIFFISLGRYASVTFENTHSKLEDF